MVSVCSAPQIPAAWAGFGLLGAAVATKRRVSAKQRREELVKKTLNVLADFEAQPESIYDGEGKLAAAV